MPIVAASLRVITAVVSVVAMAAALVVSTGAAAVRAEEEASGKVVGHSRNLARGCKRVYTFDYRVSTPSEDWGLEVIIHNPKGKAVSSWTAIGKSEGTSYPKSAKNVRYEICRRVTVPGRYRIRAKLTYRVPASFPLSPDEDKVLYFSDRFRLTRR